MRRVLVPVAASQHMFFETMMYMVSTHLDVLRGIENSRQTLLHRGNALKLIKEHLHHHQSSASDLLIVTAVGLVNYDVSICFQNIHPQALTLHQFRLKALECQRPNIRV